MLNIDQRSGFFEVKPRMQSKKYSKVEHLVSILVSQVRYAT